MRGKLRMKNPFGQSVLFHNGAQAGELPFAQAVGAETSQSHPPGMDSILQPRSPKRRPALAETSAPWNRRLLTLTNHLSRRWRL